MPDHVAPCRHRQTGWKGGAGEDRHCPCVGPQNVGLQCSMVELGRRCQTLALARLNVVAARPVVGLSEQAPETPIARLPSHPNPCLCQPFARALLPRPHTYFSNSPQCLRGQQGSAASQHHRTVQHQQLDNSYSSGHGATARASSAFMPEDVATKEILPTLPSRKRNA